MNIFVLHEDPKVAAEMHCDKHVVKMILESAQMLCTTLHHYEAPAPYKPTHKNHPCSVWARESPDNYIWLWHLMCALNKEFMYRYQKDKPHLAYIKMHQNEIVPMNGLAWPSKGLTPFAQAMPDQYKDDDAVKAYRAYYLGEKSNILNYTRREAPSWVGGRVVEGASLEN